MTIPELAGRIEERLAQLQDEIGRLRAAEDALSATRTQPAAAERAQQPRTPEPAQRPLAPDRASGRRARTHAAARGALKPAAVVTLSRELDAGLRNRP